MPNPDTKTVESATSNAASSAKRPQFRKRVADASRKGARNLIDMLRAMDENGRQQGQT